MVETENLESQLHEMSLLLEWGKKWILFCGCVVKIYIFDVIIIIVIIIFMNTALAVVTVLKSPGNGDFFRLLLVYWGRPAEPQMLEFLQRPGEDECGGNGGWLWYRYGRCM